MHHRIHTFSYLDLARFLDIFLKDLAKVQSFYMNSNQNSIVIYRIFYMDQTMLENLLLILYIFLQQIQFYNLKIPYLQLNKMYCLRFFRPLPKTRLCYNAISLKGVI